MFDLILTIVLLLITALINIFLPIQNVIIENIINLFPIIILSIRIWYNRPRNYMYLLGFINKNVKYSMTIKMENCDITESFYDKLTFHLKNLYDKSNGRIIKSNKGNYTWQQYLEVDSTLIEIIFNREMDDLYIETKAKTKFKNFIYDVEEIINKVLELFSSSCYNYDKETIEIKIRYLDRQQKEIYNPMLNKFFDNFDSLVMNLKYTTKKGTKFSITNAGIDIIGKNLKCIKNDIRHEMLLF